MNSQLWYDREGQPINSEQANALLGDMAYKRVALTEIASASDPEVSFRVSTVWLGVDHNWGGGQPILFETMVFGGGEEQDQSQWRWHTEAEARTGHAEIVASVAATVPDERVEDVADEPPNVTRISEPAAPGLHIHKWGTWQDAEATYDSPLLPKLGTWKGPVQIRRCSKCNKTETRKVA